MDILVLNCGSTSLKFGLFRALAAEVETLISGQIDAIGTPASRLSASSKADGRTLTDTQAIATLVEAVARVGRLLSDWAAPIPDALGHRIVHGGPRLRRHCLIDDGVLEALEASIPFAPLHTPAALEVIRCARAQYPGLPQVACFDTAFHADMPEVARVLPLPRDLRAEGVQRYGFHGLSCESVVHQLSDRLPERVIIAHLGGGSSVTAVMGGRSIDTSMGLTPTGGVMMSTRSGDLDPGVLLYLLCQKHFDAAGLEDLVDRRSGLLGVSGLSGDMRDLEAAPKNSDAILAIQMFEYAISKTIAAMAVALHGADLIVFTAGIGENDWQARAAICAPLQWMGAEVDDTANRNTANPLSRPTSRCRIEVLPCQEDLQIARHTGMIVESGARG